MSNHTFSWQCGWPGRLTLNAHLGLLAARRYGWTGRWGIGHGELVNGVCGPCELTDEAVDGWCRLASGGVGWPCWVV